MTSVSLDRTPPACCFRCLSWSPRVLRCKGDKLLVDIQHASLPPIPFSSLSSIGWGRYLAGEVEKQSRAPHPAFSTAFSPTLHRRRGPWCIQSCALLGPRARGLASSLLSQPRPSLCHSSLVTCCPVSNISLLSPSAGWYFLLSLSLLILFPLTKSLYCNGCSRGNGSRMKEFHLPWLPHLFSNGKMYLK